MNRHIKSAVLASLAIGGALVGTAANATNIAINTPQAGGSDLIFFVSNTATNATYSLVLTETVSGQYTYSASNLGTAGVATTYNGDAGYSINVGEDAALTSFINSAASSSDLEWGVIGGNVTATSGAGTHVAELTSSAAPLAVSNTQISSNTGGILAPNTGLEGDIETLKTETADSYNATTTGVFGTALSKSGVNVTLYGLDTAMGNNLLSTPLPFYALTTDSAGTATSVAIAFLLGNFSLTGSGSGMDLVFGGEGGSSVPLPPAVLLFGSGLLALAGVARRRKTGDLMQRMLGTLSPELA